MLIIELVSGIRCGSETWECTHNDMNANDDIDCKEVIPKPPYPNWPCHLLGDGYGRQQIAESSFCLVVMYRCCLSVCLSVCLCLVLLCRSLLAMGLHARTFLLPSSPVCHHWWCSVHVCCVAFGNLDS